MQKDFWFRNVEIQLINISVKYVLQGEKISIPVSLNSDVKFQTENNFIILDLYCPSWCHVTWTVVTKK